MAVSRTPVDVFISYASDNEQHLDALEKHLAVLQRQGAIRAWHQGRVGAGEERDAHIVDQLGTAKVVLLLVSADYLAADPYWDEMERALSRHDAGKACVIRIIVDACDWKPAPFGKLKPLPRNGQPVTSWSNQSEAWVDVVRGIRAAVEEPGRAPGHRQRLASSEHRPALHLGAALHQLRAPPADFTGRVKELADVSAKLGPGGAIIAGLTGQGGVGKTALALKLAQELAPDYPDAQIEVDLRGASAEPLTAAAVMVRAIRAFDPEAKLPETEDELGARYRSILHGKRALLLFDDARDRKQVEPLLPPSGCLVIVTSRQHFTLPGLYARRLDCLEPGDAIALVRSIAPRLDGAAAGELATLCGYLPLALRAAAGTLAEHVALQPSRYIERLRQAQERLRLVEAVLASSLDLLDASARDLWLRLGVFAEDFNAEAAVDVGAIDESLAIDLLSELVKRSLLEWDDATERYRLHDLAREYARSYLEAATRYATEMRYAEHFVNVVREAGDLYERGGESMMNGLALFDREWENINAVQQWTAARTAYDDAAAKVAAELPLVGRHCLALRQRPRERVRWYEVGLEATRRLGQRRDECYHLSLLGNAYVDMGDVRKTVELCAQALSILREIGDRRGEGDVLCNWGSAYISLGEADEAIALYKEALPIFVEIGDRWGQGSALRGLGNVHAKLGELDPAIGFYEQQMATAIDIGDRRSEGNALCGLGSVYSIRGNARKAVELCTRALRIFRELGDRQGEGEALGGLGNAHASLGDPLLAIQCYDRQMAIACDLDDREVEATSSWNIGIVYEALGNIPRAVGAMRVYVDFLRTIGHRALEQHESYVNGLRGRLA